MWGALASRVSEAAGKSPTDSSVTRARGRLPLSVWEWLFAWLSQEAQSLSSSLSSA